MSTINAANLELQLVQKINSTTNELELLALSVALRQLQNGAVFVVENYANLPSAAANVGNLFFVVADARLYVSDSVKGWVSLTVDLDVGKVYAWGRNTNGELGDNSVTVRSSPVTTAGGGTNWCVVSSGLIHTSAVKTDGTLWAWGAGVAGRLGNNSTLTQSSPVQAAGTNELWCSVSAGGAHSTAVKTTGTLWTWGCNTYGQLGESSVVARSSPGQTTGTGNTWCQASAGRFLTAAVKTDGTLWTWGANNTGQLGNSNTISRSSPGQTTGAGTTWCQVSASILHSAAVKTDGTLWTWGCNNGGQLGNSNTISRSSPGQTCGLGTTWCAASMGNAHSAAVKTDGTLWTWGYNSSGQLGDGTVAASSSPVTTAGGGTNWCAVSASQAQHSAAVKADGTLWTWGYNACGILGSGMAANRSSPGTTSGCGSNWCSASVNACNTTAIQAGNF